jgi:hypothetical protein
MSDSPKEEFVEKEVEFTRRKRDIKNRKLLKLKDLPIGEYIRIFDQSEKINSREKFKIESFNENSLKLTYSLIDVHIGKEETRELTIDTKNCIFFLEYIEGTYGSPSRKEVVCEKYNDVVFV